MNNIDMRLDIQDKFGKQLAFGDIVVVETDQIGVIVKIWRKDNHDNPPKYEVYVRNHRAVREYYEPDVDRYLVRHKELDEDEIEWQYNGVHVL